MSIDALRATPLFGDLPEADLVRLTSMARPMRVTSGERLLEEGSPGDACFVVVSGEIEVTKRSGTSELPLAVIGPGGILGEMALLEDRPRNASATAITDADVLRIPRDALHDVLARPEAAQGMLRTVMTRLRSTEALLREREKLAGLGTLAAGLAHELNNPAAAMRRSVAALEAAVASAESLPRPSPPPQPPAAPAGDVSPLDRADRIDEVASLLGNDGEAAAALVQVGWTAAALREVPSEARPWVAADASVHVLLDEARMAAERIGEIVGAVKGYAYLDQAPVQRVHVVNGLEQTLVILRHRLKAGVEVRREFAADLPEIEAYGSELNQVWTNLIDNAVDAMEGRGELLVRAEAHDTGGVRVTICDSGAGILPDVRARLFEPFFTTKPPGSGTGLGLHISHNVVARHGGRIEVESAPGRTCFVVSLPATLPR
ncbi:MAG: sensor histidine kinase [Candidatus Limnocylindria bacterium]